MKQLAMLACLFAAGRACGQVVINEAWQNPPGSGDEFYEFIEFYGPAGMSLDGYAVALVNGGMDANGDGIPETPSEIDEAFTLDGLSIGANGLLVLLNDTGGFSLAEDEVDPETAIAYFSAQHIPTSDTPGKLNNDGSSTYVLLRRRPADNFGGFDTAWRKDTDPDQNWDSHLDFGPPYQSYGRVLEPYQMVDNLAFSNAGGKEYVRESEDEISDTPGFNPDVVSRVAYYAVNPGPQGRRADEELVRGETLVLDLYRYDTGAMGGPTGFDHNNFFVTPGGFNDSATETQFRLVPGDVEFDGSAGASDFCAAMGLLGATLDDTEQRVSDNETPDDPDDDFTYDAWKYEGRAFNGLLTILDANPADGLAATTADVAALRAFMCLGDWNGDGLFNAQDMLAYLNTWSSGEPCADINIDGAINALDFLAFLNAWAGGC